MGRQAKLRQSLIARAQGRVKFAVNQIDAQMKVLDGLREALRQMDRFPKDFARHLDGLIGSARGIVELELYEIKGAHEWLDRRLSGKSSPPPPCPPQTVEGSAS